MSEKQLAETLPCCGLAPWGFEIESRHGQAGYRLICPLCGRHYSALSKEMATERWNKMVLASCFKKQRLIDADKFEKLVLNHRAYYLHKEDVIAALSRQLTVDAVEVVRCKDCKHYMTIHCTCDGCCISEDWFCADGERRTDA